MRYRALALYAVFILALFEDTALLLSVFGKVISSSENIVMNSLSQEKFNEFFQSSSFSPTLGWDLPYSYSKKITFNCIGESIIYEWQQNHRLTPGSEGKHHRIALFGDSYAHGDEVNGDATIAAVLTNTYRQSTVNYGVGGYSPAQAVMKFEELVKRGEKFDIAVLQIQHENILRLVNGFGPVYSPKTGIKYALRAYMNNGKLVFPPKYSDFSQFIALARERFRNDYFALPKAEFPYSWALIKTLASGTVLTRFRGVLLADRWESYYMDPYLTANLEVLLVDFVHFAGSHSIVPVVVFVPLRGATYQASRAFVARLNKGFGSRIAYEFRDENLDWAKYNLKPSSCHPSPYGYARIARFISEIVNSVSPVAKKD